MVARPCQRHTLQRRGESGRLAVMRLCDCRCVRATNRSAAARSQFAAVKSRSAVARSPLFEWAEQGALGTDVLRVLATKLASESTGCRLVEVAGRGCR